MANLIEFRQYCSTYSDRTVQVMCRASIDACLGESGDEAQKSCFIEVINCAFRPMSDYRRMSCFGEAPTLARSKAPEPPVAPTPPRPKPIRAPTPPRPKPNRTPTPPRPKPIRTSTPPQPAPVHAPSSVWQPDGKMKFAKSFARAGFKIKTGTHEIEIRPGFFYNGKDNSFYPELKINYTVTSLGSGRYKMQYEIRRFDGWLVGKSSGFEFTAANGRINEQLEFGITLGREGDFPYIVSALIYEYKNGNYEQR